MGGGGGQNEQRDDVWEYILSLEKKVLSLLYELYTPSSSSGPPPTLLLLLLLAAAPQKVMS